MFVKFDFSEIGGGGSWEEGRVDKFRMKIRLFGKENAVGNIARAAGRKLHAAFVSFPRRTLFDGPG